MFVWNKLLTKINCVFQSLWFNAISKTDQQTISKFSNS